MYGFVFFAYFSYICDLFVLLFIVTVDFSSVYVWFYVINIRSLSPPRRLNGRTVFVIIYGVDCVVVSVRKKNMQNRNLVRWHFLINYHRIQLALRIEFILLNNNMSNASRNSSTVDRPKRCRCSCRMPKRVILRQLFAGFIHSLTAS